MAVVVTYTRARDELASLLDRALEDREPIVITGRESGNVVLIAEDELRSLEETAHLLRSPRNAQRLLEALDRSRRNEVQAMTLEELRAEAGLDLSQAE